ncbi:cache domain-containing protein [Desulfosporosinus fructosivorans]
MFRKKVLIGVTIMILMVSLTGCAKESKVEVPKLTQPQAGVSQLPEGHPTETPATTVDKAVQTAAETKIIDLLNKNYPGDWKVSGTTLSKGTYTENGNYKMVDDVEKLFPGTMGVSIFVGEERISSSVKQGTERVLKGYATPTTVGEVMKSGTTTSSLISGYLKVYVPFMDSSGKTVAVITVSVPQA